MICPKCGAEVAEGVKFCGNCGNPMTAADPIQPAPETSSPYISQPDAGSYQVPPQTPSFDYNQPPQKKSKTGLIILIIVLAVVLIIGGAIAWFVHTVRKAVNTIESGYEDLGDIELDDIDLDDIDLDDIDVDIEGLDEAIESMESLDFSGSTDSTEPDNNADSQTTDEVSGGELHEYSYLNVTVNGNNVNMVPNGKLNGKTVLNGGKDLEGLCDYVDNNVLEAGRHINREFFYDLLATMLIDESAYDDFFDVERNMIVCLAMANNFHNIDVRVESCDLDLNKADEYHYNVVTEGGRDDTWIVNYGQQTVYFNNGSTEYSSDMFKDEYLALWMVAVEDYYGVSSY